MEAYLLSVATQSLFLVLILSGPPVIVAMIVGLMISLLQATTQVQEQSLTFVPKLVAIVLVLVFLGPLGTVKLIEFTRMLLSQFSQHIG